MSLEAIANWASVLTGEARNFVFTYYYVVEPVKRLLWKVTNLNKQLIALTGLQGTGKTSALKYIYSELRKLQKEEDKEEFNLVVLVKWTKNWRNNLEKACGAYIYEDLKEATRPKGGVYPKLSKTKKQELFDYSVRRCLEETDVILIDLPDYSKTDRRMMSRNLSEIEAFWEKYGKYANIVISIQKELFKGHFFFGKMSTIELAPLKPEEFLHVFKTQFPDCALISEEALLLLGQLSRGVFRRFLKYLGLMTESFAISNEKPPIDAAYVNKVITVNHLLKDMELELYDIFKGADQRRQAIELLNHLRRGAANQKEIAKFLNVSMMTASKIVSKLALYDYVNKIRGKRREWLISLKI